MRLNGINNFEEESVNLFRRLTMHHKRGRAKNQRAGCLMCKPQKMNGAGGIKMDVHKIGFGKLRDEAHAKIDLREAL
jgi:hypothetical protein